jgi:hypothetical protein
MKSLGRVAPNGSQSSEWQRHQVRRHVGVIDLLDRGDGHLGVGLESLLLLLLKDLIQAVHGGAGGAREVEDVRTQIGDDGLFEGDLMLLESIIWTVGDVLVGGGDEEKGVTTKEAVHKGPSDVLRIWRAKKPAIHKLSQRKMGLGGERDHKLQQHPLSQLIDREVGLDLQTT